MPDLGFDPLAVLGCDEEEFRTLMRGRAVTPGEVEAAASRHYRWRAHLHDEDAYWVTVPRAAGLLGVSSTAVRRLLSSGRLPSMTHVSGVHLIARRDVEELRERGFPGTGHPGARLPRQSGPRSGS